MPPGIVLGLALAMLTPAPADKPSGKVTVSIRAAPRVAVSPARVIFTVMKGERTIGRASIDLTIGPRPTKMKFEGSAPGNP